MQMAMCEYMPDSTGMLGKSYIEKAELETEAGTDSGSETNASGSFGQDPEARSPLPTDLEGLRQETKQLLACAASTSHLQTTLDGLRAGPPDLSSQVQRTRTVVKDVLLTATKECRLKDAFAQIRSQKEAQAKYSEIEDIRQQVKETIFSANADGRLRALLCPSRTSPLEDIRKEMKEAFLAAANKGHLSLALEEVKLNTMRAKAREALSSAAVDGTLVSQLKNIKQMQESKSNNLCQQIKEAKAASKQAEPQGEPTPLHLTNIAKLRGEALAALQSAHHSGQLSQVLAGVQRESNQETAPTETREAGEDVRGQLWQVLRSAALDGRLARAVHEVKEQRDEAEEALNVLKQVRRDLRSAALDGRMGRALSNIKQQERAQEERDVEIEDLRVQVRKSLLSAAFDGTIQRLVSKAQPPNIEDARATARKALGRAVADGSLQALLGRVRQAKDLKQSRASARVVISEAALDGRLGATLASLQRQRQGGAPEAAAAQARSILSDAAMDGRLREALLDARRSRAPSSEVLRLQAQDTFCKEALDGRLSQVILEAKAHKAQTAQKVAGEVIVETKKESAAAKHFQLEAMIAGSAHSGHLAEALRARRPEAEAEAPREEEDLREIAHEARSVLVAAVQDGRLAMIRRGQLRHSEGASPLAPEEPAAEPPPSREEAIEAQPSSPMETERSPTSLQGPCSSERRSSAKEPPVLHRTGSAPSSRQRRRIIGAVGRAPKAAFCLSLTEDAGWKDEVPPSVAPASPASRPPPSPTQPPSSRHNARHRVHLAMSSAMALDLGEEFAGARSAAGEDCNRVPASAMTLDLDLGLGGKRWGGSSPTATPTNRLRTSHSMGSICTTKLQGGARMTFAMPQAYSTKATTTTLPALQGQRRTPGAVAWSQQLSWNTSRWGS